MKSHSWLPVAAAFIIPAVVIVGSYTVSAAMYRNNPDRFAPAAPVTPISNVEIKVRLENKAGAPLANLAVSFHHHLEGGAGATNLGSIVEFPATTNEEGLATVQVKKVGNVSIHVAGKELTETIRDLEKHTINPIDLTIVLDQ